jgi:hypothetical protein
MYISHISYLNLNFQVNKKNLPGIPFEPKSLVNEVFFNHAKIICRAAFTKKLFEKQSKILLITFLYL